MERAMKTHDKGAVPFFLLLLLWPALFIGLFLAGARVWQAAQRPILRHRITANREELTARAEQELAAADGDVWIGELYIPASGDAVWYRESGFGLAPSSVEYGYFYAADGEPHAYPGMEYYDETPAKRGFRWEEPGGDNGCYAEHVAGQLYYYEVWF